MPGAEAQGGGEAPAPSGPWRHPASPPRCLITGGSGFFGINPVRHLLARGYRVRVLDRLPFDYPEHRSSAALHGVRLLTIV
jgi:nucleoside-diphosphate-sugar epimerase